MDTMQEGRPTLSPQDQRHAGGLPSKAGPRSPRRNVIRESHARRSTDEGIVRALGWFSITLGAIQLLAPRTLSRAIGINDRPLLMRTMGLREIGAGVGILAQPKEPTWLWARVAGDALDLALLGVAMASAGRSRGRAVAATAVVAGVTALDVYASRQASGYAKGSGNVRADGSIRVERSIAINRPPEECYRLWQDFANLPRFMTHLKSVTVTGPGRSHWVAKAPAGTTVEWDSEVTNEQPGEFLAWRSLEGADVDNSGAVRFIRDPAGKGTIVSVTMQYTPPGGALGAAVAKLFGEEPEQQVSEDLRRFKRILEAGEVPTTEGQSSGPRPLWHQAAGGGER